MTDTSALGTTVATRVTRLQEGYLAPRQTARAVATLATLRRAAIAPVGSIPEIWEQTALPWIDDSVPGVTDAPTTEELASHTAMTLYALHQQSQGTRMHVRSEPGRSHSLGAAVAQLIATVDNPGRRVDADRESSLRRRFNALVTAATFREISHHLRGLVFQFRSQGIGLDYGQLAEDLAALQDRCRADGVRRRWSRDLTRQAKTATDSKSGDFATEPSPSNPEEAS